MFSLSIILFVVSTALAKNVHIDLSSLDERAMGKPSEATGELVAQWKPDDLVNAEELGEYAQGDILFVAGSLKNGLAPDSTRWPNGIIPFEIVGGFGMLRNYLIYIIDFYLLVLNLIDAFEMANIEEAMEDYHINTCIRFMPRTGRERDYIRISDSKSGCWSSVGRVGGMQEINLQRPACLRRKGTIVHELMHAVGFLHEQNRENRDDHVDIMWNNIKKSKL